MGAAKMRGADVDAWLAGERLLPRGFMCLAVKATFNQRWRTFMLLDTMAHSENRSDCPHCPNAVLCGEVTIVRQFYRFGAVLTAGERLDHGRSATVVIMDTATIRGLKRNPMRIGDNVLVGHELSHWLRGRGQRFSRHRSDSV